MSTAGRTTPNSANRHPMMVMARMAMTARTMAEEMKMAATRALAQLAKEDVPESVSALYGLTKVKFGNE